MTVKLLTEYHLEFLSLKGGCTGSSESTLVKCHIVGNHMLWAQMVILETLKVKCGISPGSAYLSKTKTTSSEREPN